MIEVRASAPAPAADADEKLLTVTELRKEYSLRTGSPMRRHVVAALDGVSFSLARGRTLSLVGESGSGKTTTAKIILGLERPTSGGVSIDGRDAGDGTMHRRVQVVFQDPGSSLDPRMTVGAIIEEPMRRGKLRRRAEWRTRALALLSQVGLEESAYRKHPHAFSGGQRQRIAIARALATDPELIVLDEPFSSLDASVRGQIINLLIRLQIESGTAYLLISHDLASVRALSDDVAVLYSGHVVEQGPADAIFKSPRHPYTKALLAAANIMSYESGSDDGIDRQVDALPGAGCPFQPRCPSASARCAVERPTPVAIDSRLVACHLFGNVGH